MKSFVDRIANLFAFGAIIVYAVAAIGYLTGQTSLVLGFHAASVVVGGTALMSLAIFAKLQAR